MRRQSLPFNYEAEKKEKDLTGLSVLLLYLGLFNALRLDKLINKHLKIKKDKQGYRDNRIILILILLNLAGGESVSDVEILEKDIGFCQIFKSMELRVRIFRSRAKIRRRWRNKIKDTLV